MTGMRDDLERRRHHRQPRRGAGTHWAPGDKALLHVGPVRGCPEPECVASRKARQS